ncbi:hypothetical protein PHMEG_00023049 [Phytophthora megakarya]|uniref:ZSWIM1/3 RNaseH-like domain-containing protein n=1 Tax=Phytophthora megakarya TaxID=4795 RepID=A0A225VHY8_9STRA|nr:hypothetical protein PHMEG_00023049 [Phytophthora megakarya]
MEDRIRAILEDLAPQKGNVTRVLWGIVMKQNVVECTTVQSAYMHSMFEHFPEILLIDRLRIRYTALGRSWGRINASCIARS